MTITVKTLYIDGIEMPAPAVEGLTITSNKMWSANTGRLETSGEMAGTIVAIKTKIEIKWPPLPMEKVQLIENAVSSLTPFHTMKYTDMTGVTHEKTVYFGDPSYTMVSYGGPRMVKDISVSAIEK